jgi:hypothetical protein
MRKKTMSKFSIEKSKRKINFLLHLMALALTAWVLILTIIVFSMYEGYFFPVVTPLEITSIDRSFDVVDGFDWFTVRGNFTKIRDCVPVTVRWYYGDPRNSSRIDAVPVPTLVGPDPDLGNQPRNFELGVQQPSYLRVRLEPELIREDSHAYVYHRCHGPYLWETRTLLYDSRLDTES